MTCVSIPLTLRVPRTYRNAVPLPNSRPFSEETLAGHCRRYSYYSLACERGGAAGLAAAEPQGAAAVTASHILKKNSASGCESGA